MVVNFSIEYKTVWGESLVLLLSGKEIPMKGNGNGLWAVKVSGVKAEHLEEYGYRVVRADGSRRREWKHHSLHVAGTSASASLTVRDRWMDQPVDAPFYASAFTDGIFSRKSDEEIPGSLISKGTALIVVDMPVVARDETLALVGNGKFMDNWNKVLPLDSSNFPQWTIAVDAKEPFEYKLVIADANTLEIKQWEGGENRVLRTDGKFTIIADGAHRFGLRRWRGAGTAIPVFSLRSEDDFGVGEFYDLKKMIDWAVITRQSVLQLLPINDTTMTGTWTDSYPYNANSTFALHPQFINLQAAGVKLSPAAKKLQKELNSLKQVDYERVNTEKLKMLRAAFKKNFSKLSETVAYRSFYINNLSWLRPYAAFCALRDAFGTAEFAKWGEYSVYSDEVLQKCCEVYADDVNFWCYVQYHLDAQMKEVRAYACEKGVVLKGDLPIGISRTSVDAWQYPHLFNMDSCAGAPPDAFSADGQNWGFPTYNWDEMSKDGYAWWKARMQKMSEYFDLFRIDHILGFFRIWEIPLAQKSGLLGHFSPALPYPTDELMFMGFDVAAGECVTPGPDGPTDVLFVEDPVMKGYWHPRISAQNTSTYRNLDGHRQRAFNRLHDDFFYRRHNAFWRDSAMRKLPSLLHATQMLACGEDLGMIPDCVASVMDELKILSLEIQRMPKSTKVEFGNPAHYPYFCVCTTSTHDMNPVRAWWEEDRAVSQRFYNTMYPGQAPYFCEPWLCERIVDDHLKSPAMLTILPLQDWLSIDGSLRCEDPASERINVPAISRHYWRYRMHINIEGLLAQKEYNAKIAEMVTNSGRK